MYTEFPQQKECIPIHSKIKIFPTADAEFASYIFILVVNKNYA